MILRDWFWRRCADLLKRKLKRVAKWSESYTDWEKCVLLMIRENLKTSSLIFMLSGNVARFKWVVFEVTSIYSEKNWRLKSVARYTEHLEGIDGSRSSGYLSNCWDKWTNSSLLIPKLNENESYAAHWVGIRFRINANQKNKKLGLSSYIQSLHCIHHPRRTYIWR